MGGSSSSRGSAVQKSKGARIRRSQLGYPRTKVACGKPSTRRLKYDYWPGDS